MATPASNKTNHFISFHGDKDDIHYDFNKDKFPVNSVPVDKQDTVLKVKNEISKITGIPLDHLKFLMSSFKTVYQDKEKIQSMIEKPWVRCQGERTLYSFEPDDNELLENEENLGRFSEQGNPLQNYGSLKGKISKDGNTLTTYVAPMLSFSHSKCGDEKHCPKSVKVFISSLNNKHIIVISNNMNVSELKDTIAAKQGIHKDQVLIKKVVDGRYTLREEENALFDEQAKLEDLGINDGDLLFCTLAKKTSKH